MNKTFIPNSFPIQEAAIIKLLGHPIRLRILTALNKNNCSVKDIWERLDLKQSVVSKHLAIMKNHGIIAGSRCGVRMYYQIQHPLAQRIITAISRTARN